MFESVNLNELARVVQSVITTGVVAEGTMWKLTDDQRHKIRLAMFGPGMPNGGMAEVSVMEQREMLSEFTSKVAGPMIDVLPPHTAAWAMLMLYEEFVDAVFVEAVLAADVGGGD